MFSVNAADFCNTVIITIMIRDWSDCSANAIEHHGVHVKIITVKERCCNFTVCQGIPKGACAKHNRFHVWQKRLHRKLQIQSITLPHVWNCFQYGPKVQYCAFSELSTSLPFSIFINDKKYHHVAFLWKATVLYVAPTYQRPPSKFRIWKSWIALSSRCFAPVRKLSD